MVAIKRVSMRSPATSQYDSYLTKCVARELLNQQACGDFPYVVKLLDWYRSQDGFDVYLVLEKWPHDLRQYLIRLQVGNRVAKMDLDGSRVIMCQLLIALDFLHGRNIFHRDLSLSNVFVNPEVGKVALADFGLSKVVADQYLAPGMDGQTINIGTAPYNAPEILCQCTAPPNPKWSADIWSLGCIFLEIVTGAPFMVLERDLQSQLMVLRPVDFHSLATLMQQRKCGEQWVNYFASPHCREKITASKRIRLSERMMTLPAEVRDIISKMLVIDPSQRLCASALLQLNIFKQDSRCVELIEEYQAKWSNVGSQSQDLVVPDPIDPAILIPRTADASVPLANW